MLGVLPGVFHLVLIFVFVLNGGRILVLHGTPTGRDLRFQVGIQSVGAVINRRAQEHPGNGGAYKDEGKGSNSFGHLSAPVYRVLCNTKYVKSTWILAS